MFSIYTWKCKLPFVVFQLKISKQFDHNSKNIVKFKTPEKTIVFPPNRVLNPPFVGIARLIHVIVLQLSRINVYLLYIDWVEIVQLTLRCIYSSPWDATTEDRDGSLTGFSSSSIPVATVASFDAAIDWK